MRIRPPSDRQGFTTAIICALSHEADYIESVFDLFWEDEGKSYGKAGGDLNSYTTGVIAGHNVVLAYSPGMGKVNAAHVASHLRISFTNIRFVIVAGICGGVPYYGSANEEVLLGDVIISQGLIQYDFGRQYPGLFARKASIEDSLGRSGLEIRSLLTKLQTFRSRQLLQEEISTHVKGLQAERPGATYPGIHLDRLYQPTYVHRHQQDSTNQCQICCTGGVCFDARTLGCSDLGCEDSQLVTRERLVFKSKSTVNPSPLVHFGKVGSGDTVMKSGELRDRMANADGIIAFEMEGAGIWEYFPSVIVKGVCDYADSHKNNIWQAYAAATAACCVKVILHHLTAEEGGERLKEQSHQGTGDDPTHYVPFDRLRDFIGRKNEIDILKRHLLQPDNSDRVAVFGLGGVGKSRIAREMASYAMTVGQYSVLWVEATSTSTLEKDYREIAERLSIPGNARKVDIKHLVHEWLSSPSAGNWMMIIDGADDENLWSKRSSSDETRVSIAQYIPRSAMGSVLITTRSRRIAVQLAGQNVIELGNMETSEAIDMFSSQLITARNVTTEDTSLVSLLMQQLSFLPLAIVQAAAYINLNGSSVRDYLELVQDAKEENIMNILSVDFEDESRYRYAQNAIASTWLISFQQLQHSNSRAIDFLAYMACLGEKDIPESILLSTSSKKELSDITGVLVGYCFVQKQYLMRQDMAVFSMHRLVRLATRNWLRSQGTLEKWTINAVKQVYASLPGYDHNIRHTAALVIPHANLVCADSKGLDIDDRYLLLRRLGGWLTKSSPETAVDCLTSVLEWQNKRSGAMNKNTIDARWKLGFALSSAGNFVESERQLRKAAEDADKILGPTHVIALDAKAQLIRILVKLQRESEAMSLGQQLLEHKEVLAARSVSFLLEFMGSLARLYRKQGKLDGAERLLRQQLDIVQQYSSQGACYTSEAMTSLAEYLWSFEGREEAKTLLAQALKLSLEEVERERISTMCNFRYVARKILEASSFEWTSQHFPVLMRIHEKASLGENEMDGMLECIELMGRASYGQQHYQAATAHFQKMLEILQETKEENHAQALLCKECLVQIDGTITTTELSLLKQRNSMSLPVLVSSSEKNAKRHWVESLKLWRKRERKGISQEQGKKSDMDNMLTSSIPPLPDVMPKSRMWY